MKKIAIGCGILAALGLLLLVIVVIAGGSYNRLVSLDQGVNSAWAQVQNDYQRRSDLVPNLVATVSGAANFEKSTLTEITEARASVGQVKIDAKNAPTDSAKLAEFDQAQGAFVVGAVAVAGGGGALPGFEGEREFPGVAGAVGGDGEPDHGGAAGFQ